MHTYTAYISVYREYSLWRPVHDLLVSLPKPKRVIGRRRRYHNSTTPPLDFRSCFVSRFSYTEDQNGSREFNAENSSRLDERVR